MWLTSHWVSWLFESLPSDFIHTSFGLGTGAVAAPWVKLGENSDADGEYLHTTK